LVDCATGLLAANKPDTLATTAALFQSGSIHFLEFLFCYVNKKKRAHRECNRAASDAGDLKAQYSWAAMQRLGLQLVVSTIIMSCVTTVFFFLSFFSFLSTGRGTARNAPAAMHLFKELANKGHGISAFNVGSMQQSGEGYGCHCFFFSPATTHTPFTPKHAITAQQKMQRRR
jgi:hypothetical protein